MRWEGSNRARGVQKWDKGTVEHRDPKSRGRLMHPKSVTIVKYLVGSVDDLHLQRHPITLLFDDSFVGHSRAVIGRQVGKNGN